MSKHTDCIVLPSATTFFFIFHFVFLYPLEPVVIKPYLCTMLSWRPSDKFRSVKEQCPDMVEPTEHLVPKKLFNNALIAAILQGLYVGTELLTKYQANLQSFVEEEQKESPDEQKLAEIQDKCDSFWTEAKNNVIETLPRSMLWAVTQDFLVRSVNRLLEYAMVHFADVSTCRKLTTLLNKESKRIDSTSIDDKPTFGSVLLTACSSAVLIQLSQVVVGVGYDIVVAYFSKSQVNKTHSEDTRLLDSSDSSIDEPSPHDSQTLPGYSWTALFDKIKQKFIFGTSAVFVTGGLTSVAYQFHVATGGNVLKMSHVATIVPLVQPMVTQSILSAIK